MGKGKRRRKSRVDQVADQILEKIEQAVEELTVQPVTQVRKEKDVFYENQDNPGKVTREVVQETQTVSLVDVPVDAAKLQPQPPELYSKFKEKRKKNKEKKYLKIKKSKIENVNNEDE